MIRRKPTSITLTPEDIALYDDSRAARLARLDRTEENIPLFQSLNGGGNDAGKQNRAADGKVDPNDELKPLPGGGRAGGPGGERERERERDARIMGR